MTKDEYEQFVVAMNPELTITEIQREVGDYCRMHSLQALVAHCHKEAVERGWWAGVDVATAVPGKLMLCVSELAEAMEADRKGLMDDHLPDRKGIEVELADCLIRICDLAGALELDLGAALVEKMKFNRQRKDHDPAARLADGGKKY